MAEESREGVIDKCLLTKWGAAPRSVCVEEKRVWEGHQEGGEMLI